MIPFWKKKLPEIKTQPLLNIEDQILNCLADNLETHDAERIKGQITYFLMTRRISLTTTVVLELYAESLNAIPENLLFKNRGEFILAKLKFSVGEVLYSTQVCMVLGSLSYLKTKPNYLKVNNKAGDFKLVKIDAFLD